MKKSIRSIMFAFFVVLMLVSGIISASAAPTVPIKAEKKVLLSSSAVPAREIRQEIVVDKLQLGKAPPFFAMAPQQRDIESIEEQILNHIIPASNQNIVLTLLRHGPDASSGRSSEITELNDEELYSEKSNDDQEKDKKVKSNSKKLEIASTEIIGDTIEGRQFTIRVTATDTKNLVTSISLGRSPYNRDDFETIDCVPQANSCTADFEVMEEEPGTYAYMIKAKNDKDKEVSDAVTVNVLEELTADQFNFATALVDGGDYSNGVVTYVNSEITLSVPGSADQTAEASPLALFSIPSSKYFEAAYSAVGYPADSDSFYLDSRLPSCSGDECEFTALADETEFTTSCVLVLSDYHYLCTLSNSDSDAVLSFEYRALGDPAGENTARYYNPVYMQSSPVVEFGTLDASFNEGSSLVLSLNDYVTDADTAASALVWSVSGNENLNVVIDSSTHEAAISALDPDWIGNEMLTFTAEDPEGNTGSDILTVRVLNSGNDAPVITLRDPEEENLMIAYLQNMEFFIEANDPDFDPLSVIWKEDGAVVAVDTYYYEYEDVDGLPVVLSVIVSDGELEAIESWSITVSVLEGEVSGVVSDSATGEPVEGVAVEFYNEAGTIAGSTYTDYEGYYDQTLFEGGYDVHFSKEGYVEFVAEDFMIDADMHHTLNVDLAAIPKTGFVQGIAKDSSTLDPLENVLVEALQSDEVIQSTRTDDSGEYSMELIVGTYEFRASLPGYQILQIPSVEILEDETTTADISLVAAVDPMGTIQGFVTSQETGDPIEGANVEVLDEGTVVASQLTNSEGFYSIEVVGAVYDISASGDGFYQSIFEGVSVAPGDTATLDISLAPIPLPSGILSGRVIDQLLTEGLPEVFVQANNDVDPVFSVFTDDGGLYEIQLPPGTYTVSFSKDGYYDYVSDDVEITDGSTVVLNVELFRTPISGGILIGFVSEAYLTEPLQDVLVEAKQGVNSVETAITNSLGNYEISDIAAGLYNVSFSKCGYYPSVYINASVMSGRVTETSAVLVPLPETIGSVYGQVIDDETEEPIPGAYVEILDEEYVVNSTYTDSSGEYSMNVVSGSYDIRISKDGYSNQYYEGVFIPGCAETEMDFVLFPNSYSGELIGVVSDSVTMSPVPDARVAVLQDSVEVSSVLTNPMGEYYLELSEGIYEIEVTKEDYIPYSELEISVIAGETTTKDVTIEFSGTPTGTIEGVVMDNFERPVHLVDVYVMDGEDQVGYTVTGINGFYFIDVPEGTYNMIVEKIGFYPEEQIGVNVNRDSTTIVDFLLTIIS